MIEFELWPHRVSVHIGDFTEALFLPGYDEAVRITGLMTESEPGVFGFVLMAHNWGIGICLRFRPGPWTPDEDCHP